jgi:hypothetical protein
MALRQQATTQQQMLQALQAPGAARVLNTSWARTACQKMTGVFVFVCVHKVVVYACVVCREEKVRREEKGGGENKQSLCDRR